jgi:acyl-CoA synthetase (AMP-forming)/AMP-acid ligase II
MINSFIKVFESNMDKPAVLFNNTVFTYRQLLDSIEIWRQFIRNHSIFSGETVSVKADFSKEAIALIFALIENKSIIIPLNASSGDNSNKLLISGAKHIFTFFDDDSFKYDINYSTFTHDFYNELNRRNTPGIVLFSSGSSGTPKAAVHDLNKLLLKFNSKKLALRTLNFLLFDHWGGLNTMFHILSCGGLVITCRDRSPSFICNLIETYKIQLLPASPTFLKLLLLSGVYEKHNLGSLQMITYGTEPMPESTLIKLKQVFPDMKLLQTYGLIELGVLHTKSKSDDSLWMKIGGDGYSHRVVDGLLEIKAESAMLGYLNAESPYTQDGWFKTNDSVLVEGEYLKILGRQSELINVGGDKVFPQEIESVILELDFIKDVLVYGESNSLVGNIVCSKIQLIENFNHELINIKSEIKKYCKTKLSPFKVPVKIIITKEDLVNSRFKKNRLNI